jgi:hypothetical protein
MTVFSAVVDKAACEHCAWETTAVSRRKAIQRSEGHYLETEHDQFDFSHQLRFEGEK